MISIVTLVVVMMMTSVRALQHSLPIMGWSTWTTFQCDINETLVKESADTMVRDGFLDAGYDYILIDCPPSLGLLTLNALTSSDSVLIPIQCEYYALEGLGQLLNTVRLVQQQLNTNLEIEGVLLTMYDQRLNLSKQVADEVRSFFDDKVFETIIQRNVRLSEAPSFGKPALMYAANSMGAQNYLDLVEEILKNGN